MYITFKERHTCIYFLYILNMAWHDIPWQMPYSMQHLHNTLYTYNHTLHYLYKDIVYMHSFIHIFIQSNVCFFKFNVYLCLRKCYKRNTEEKCMLCVRIICYFFFYFVSIINSGTEELNEREIVIISTVVYAIWQTKV